MKMTCKNTLLMAILISPYALSAQLVATTTASPPLTPTSLVQQSLVGTGVTVSNVTTNIPLGADPRQFAEFTNANTILPLGNGIMLSTGYADDYNNIGNNDPGFRSLHRRWYLWTW